MKLERITIDGFGQLQGLDLQLGPGLNLICGPNEAGKSTLLAFIRGVLFGFEKRGDPSRYETDGGPYGGELWLQARAGRLRARRAGGKRVQGELIVRSEAGEVLPETRLREALAHVEKELFYEVFAFNLDALASFDRLAKSTGVGEALFAAGMRGARRLPEATAELRKVTEELFSPRAQQKRLNAAFRELEQVQDELAALGDRPAEYFALEAERARLSEEHETLRRRSEALSAQLAALERLERCAEAVVELGVLRPSLEPGRGLLGFSDDALPRLDALIDRLAAARTAHGVARAELEDVSAALARLERPDPARVSGVERSLARLERRAALDDRLPSRRATLAQRAVELETAFKRLGLPGSVENLAALDLGASARARLVGLREGVGHARQRAREREAQYEAAVSARQRTGVEVRRLEDECAALPSEPAASVRRRQEALARVEASRGEARQACAQAEELRARLEGLGAEVEPAPVHPFPGWSAAATAGVIAAIAAAVSLRVPEVASLAAAGAGVLSALVAFAWQRGRSAFHAQRAAVAARAETRAKERARLGAALEQAQQAERAAGVEATDAAREAGVDVDAPRSALAQESDRLASLLSRIEQRHRVEEALRAARAAELLLADEVERARQQAAAAASAAGDEEAKVGALLESCGLPRVTPEHALELWNDAAALQQRLAELELEARSIEREEAERSRALGELVAELGAALEPVPDPDEAVRVAREACARWARACAEREQLEARASALEGSLKLGEAELAELQRRMTVLLDQTGAASEAALRERARRAAEAKIAHGRANALELQVRAATGLPPDEAERRLTEAGGAQAVSAKSVAVAEELRDVRERLATVGDLRVRIGEHLRLWENDAKVAGLREREEHLAVEVRRLSERYVVDRLALGMLEQARARHEREHQPRLLAEASAAFAALTGGRYGRVLAPLEGGLEVEQRDGRIWSAEKLSRGTQNQLYLAFRVALVREFAASHGPLPVILDDILVNFDPERAQAAVKTFGQLAETHQVIAFSCQRHLRETFAAEGARIFELNAPGAPLWQAKTA